ncbi:MAG: DUF58 domain-containing protein [Sandaracinaceae bacterium]
MRRIADWFPLTWLGILVAIGAWAALEKIAYAELDLVWLVVGFALLGLVAASLLSVLIGALVIKITTRAKPHAEIEPHSMDTQRVNPTGFDTPTFWFLPLTQIDWTWERPEEADVSIAKVRWRLREKVKLSRRGHVKEVRRRIVIQDPFGLARLAIRQTAPVRLTVLPHVGKLGDTPMLVSLSGGDERPHPMGVDDGDRVELRRYVPGDPARFIHWKVYGRTRKLMVRVPERALSPARRTVAYQVAGPGDDASAAAARIAVESGAFGGDWVFSADGASKDTSRADEAVEMIVASADAADRGAVGLGTFLARAERKGPASAVLFVPPRPGPWLDRVVQAVRPRAVRTRVVVTTDGIDTRPPPPWWRRMLVLPEPREGTPSAELDQVIRALAATRVEVILLDRKSGKRLGDRHRAAMRKAEGKRAA